MILRVEAFGSLTAKMWCSARNVNGGEQKAVIACACFKYERERFRDWWRWWFLFYGEIVKAKASWCGEGGAALSSILLPMKAPFAFKQPINYFGQYFQLENFGWSNLWAIIYCEFILGAVIMSLCDILLLHNWHYKFWV